MSSVTALQASTDGKKSDLEAAESTVLYIAGAPSVILYERVCVYPNVLRRLQIKALNAKVEAMRLKLERSQAEMKAAQRLLASEVRAYTHRHTGTHTTPVGRS